ncbi:MAG: Gfo/Idh/MocA family oxidoreductase [Chloroflexota bacterium]
MKPLHTAILGCGGFAHRHAQNLLTLSDEVQMVAFCDTNPQNAQAYAEKYTAGKAAIYTDLHELLEKQPLDLLLICLPPFAHSDEVTCAAQRGIHIFIEKPIALTSEHAWQMVADVEKSGIKTQVGFMFRFGEAIEELKALIESGSAGRPGLMAARYFCNSLHAPWWRMREKSGGQLVEQIIHMLDLMRYLLGEPAFVYSCQENLFHQHIPDYTVEDVSVTVVGFKNGALGTIHATNGAIPNRWINDYKVVTQNITAEFTNANNASLFFTTEADTPQKTIASERNVHLFEMRDLLHAIRENGPTRTPMSEGAKSLDLALAARRSAEEHCKLTLD